MVIFDIHKDGRTIFSTAWRSSSEMIVQGYKDARRKRCKVDGPVVSDVLFDTVSAGAQTMNELRTRIAVAHRRQMDTEILFPKAREIARERNGWLRRGMKELTR